MATGGPKEAGTLAEPIVTKAPWDRIYPDQQQEVLRAGIDPEEFDCLVTAMVSPHEAVKQAAIDRELLWQEHLRTPSDVERFHQYLAADARLRRLIAAARGAGYRVNLAVLGQAMVGPRRRRRLSLRSFRRSRLASALLLMFVAAVLAGALGVFINLLDGGLR